MSTIAPLGSGSDMTYEEAEGLLRPLDPSGETVELAGFVDDSIVDGPGLRFAIFAQGCPHRCPGCHNPTTWSRGDGRVMTAPRSSIGFPAARSDGWSCPRRPVLPKPTVRLAANALRKRGGSCLLYR